MNRMPKVSKETLLKQLLEKDAKDLAVLYGVSLQQFYYCCRKHKIILSKKTKQNKKVNQPFKLTVKLELAFTVLKQGNPFDVAAKTAGISVSYLQRMFYLYNQQVNNIQREETNIKLVANVLKTMSTKNMSQKEACALHGLSYSTFQYNYSKGKKKGVFK